MILVDNKDGHCPCGGQWEIVGVTDATMDVECTECRDSSTVEPDAFNDGGIKYWPEAMIELGEENF